MSSEQPQIPFQIIWDFAQQTKCWHTCAGLLLDMVGSLALFSHHPAADLAPGIAEAVMQVLDDPHGTFLMAWKQRFRADPVQATSDWQREVEPELIAKWMAETDRTVSRLLRCDGWGR